MNREHHTFPATSVTMSLAGASILGLALAGCAGAAEDAATESPPDSPTTSQSGGGQFATELVGESDFTTEPDSERTGEKAQQQVLDGRLVLTNIGPGLTWQSSEIDQESGSAALLVAGELELAPELFAAEAPGVAAGVGVGSSEGTWDYFLTCGTNGLAVLQRSGDTEAIELAEFSDAGCGETFTLALEAYQPTAGNTQLFLTLPNGTSETVTDDAAYGPFSYYGFMVYGQQYPVTASVLNGQAYAAPQ